MQSTVLDKPLIVQVSDTPSLRRGVPSMTTLQEPHSRRVIERETNKLIDVSSAR